MIKPICEKYDVNYVIANVENAAGGFGITPEMSHKIFTYGVNIQTSGNHIWDRIDIQEYMKQESRLLRPANYPSDVPGHGFYVDTVGEVKIGVINLMGRTYMGDIDCPFRTVSWVLRQISDEVKVVFVDFHAEATSEKQAMLYFLDGQVSAIIGTHTHVQTADEKISTRGTAYLTDAGMTGPHESIIGMEIGPSLGRFLTGMPKRFTTASKDIKLSGVIVKVDTESGRAESLERIVIDFNIEDYQNKQKLDDY